MMQRNTATTLKVFAFNRTTNAPVTGDAANLSCKVSIDGGARVALADTTATELEDGYYLFDVSASETNGSTIDFFPESTTSNVVVLTANVSRYTSVESQIKTKTDLITSTTNFVTVERVAGSTITMYYNEATTATVALDEDTTSLTLRFVVENSDQLDVLVIENASITRTASNFTVTITTAVTATLGQYKWSLRDITGGINRVVQLGVLQVVGAANKDA